MAKVPSYFNDFLKDIRLTPNQVSDLIKGHKTLSDRLKADEDLSDKIVNIFLQGSYRRSTAIRPKNGKRSDVDVVVVTNLDQKEYTPEQAHDLFIPFLDKHYKDKYRVQGRSLGIELSYVDLDLVVTSAPSETNKNVLEDEGISTDYTIEELNEWTLQKSNEFPNDPKSESFLFFEKVAENDDWKAEPLYIPNRDAAKWEATNPLEQIRWTWQKNKDCNTYYINVVKALKWWRRNDNPDGNYPKSYPLEHFIGVCCPDGITSIAQGVTETLEKIVNSYPQKPVLTDHGVPEHDVFERLTIEEYDIFYDRVKIAAELARDALDTEDVHDSVIKWRKIFGNKFPPSKKETNTFTKRADQTHIGGNRFA